MSDAALEYDCEGDERWREYLASLEFPGGVITTEQLKRRKRQWYKRNIDSSYVPPTEASATEGTGTDSTLHSAPREMKQSSERTAHEPRSHPQSAAQWGALWGHIRQQPYQAVWLAFTSGAMVLSWMLLLSLGHAQGTFRPALSLAMAAYGLNLLLTHGRPRWSQDYAQAVTPDPNLHFLIYCAIFWPNTPMLIPVIPLLVYATYNTADCLRMLAAVVYPGRRDGSTFLERTLDGQKAKMTARMGTLEIYIMAYLVMMIFSRRVTLFMPFLYYNFLRLRYHFDVSTQQNINALLGVVDRFVNGAYVPGLVRSLWYRLRR